MLILPSVGSRVTKIVLNESATAAKITYDDGSTTVVRVKNTPNVSSVKKTTVTPSGVVKKKVVKKTTSGGGTVINRSSMMNMESVSPNAMAQRAPSVIERAKRRAELLEQQTMDAGSIAAMAMQEGQEIPTS